MMIITIILAAGAVGFGLSKWLGLPVVPLLVLAGIGLHAGGLLDEPDQMELVEKALVLGLTFLVFVAGTELNPSRIGAQRRAAIRVGLAQFAALAGIGLVAALLIGFDLHGALYLALALTASSTLVVVDQLRRRQQFFEPFGRLVLGVLLLQDLLVILLIPVLTRADEGVVAVGVGILGTLGLVLMAWVCLRWITPFLLIRLRLDEESLLLVVLAILFSFVGLSQVFGLPLVSGAFLAGVSLSAFPVHGLIRGQLNSLSDFFLAVFFVALGATLTLPAPGELLLAAGLALMVLVLTPPLVTIIGEKTGLSSRSAIESGLLLAQCSEFSIIVALLARERGHLDDGTMAVIALFTVITMILTPLIATDRVAWRLMRWHPSSRRPDTGERPADHVLLVGCGETTMPLLDQLVQSGQRVAVIDDDPVVIEKLHRRGIPAFRGDGADFFVLRSAGARSAKAIVSTMRRVRDNQRLLEFVKSVPVLVRVFSPEHAEAVRSRGGTPILDAHAAAADLVTWLESRTATRRAPMTGGNA